MYERDHVKDVYGFENTPVVTRRKHVLAENVFTTSDDDYLEFIYTGYSIAVTCSIAVGCKCLDQCHIWTGKVMNQFEDVMIPLEWRNSGEDLVENSLKPIDRTIIVRVPTDPCFPNG